MLEVQKVGKPTQITLWKIFERKDGKVNVFMLEELNLEVFNIRSFS